MPKDKQAGFWLEIEDLDSLLKIDIVHITKNTDKTLKNNIEKDGVILMSKYLEKLTKFKSAVCRLNESIIEYNQTKSLSVRDGVIQRFEFCTELAWKTVREKLIDEGFTELNSPKSVMREAYANNIITDEQNWIKLLSDRNKTSHIYSEETADEIYQNIETIYYRLFTDLIKKL